jgi:hypothetical protein
MPRHARWGGELRAPEAHENGAGQMTVALGSRAGIGEVSWQLTTAACGRFHKLSFGARQIEQGGEDLLGQQLSVRKPASGTRKFVVVTTATTLSRGKTYTLLPPLPYIAIDL